MSRFEAASYNMVIKQLRKNASHIEAYMLTTRSNPQGAGVFIYRPRETQREAQDAGKTLSIAAAPLCLVVGDQAYALTEVARKVTPSLKLYTSAPHILWAQTNTADKVKKQGMTPALAFTLLYKQ